MKGSQTKLKVRKHKPAESPEEREAYMVDLAMKRAEQQMIDGTASSQVITHYLKLGTAKEKKELALLDKQIALAEAKTQALHSAEEIKKLYDDAMAKMSIYRGEEDGEDSDIQ